MPHTEAMRLYLHSGGVFALGLIVTFVATPFFIKFALARGIVDKPEARRVNEKTTARFGGPAIFLGFVAAMAAASPRVPGAWFIVAGASIIFVTGMIDDIRGLGAFTKLAAQIAAAVFMYFTGTRLSFITNPFGDYFYIAGWLSFIFTILWIVGITNTLNLIDGLDGLSAGITLISCVTFFLVALTKGQGDSALISVALVGACAGFLRWNFYPAKTFMGDSGALFLGFVVSVIALNGSFKSTTVVAYLLPVLALGVPIFDTSFAILRRLRNHQPVMSAPDKGHVHHRLLAAGLLHRQAVIIIYIVTLCLSMIALALSRAFLLMLYLFAAIVALTYLLILLGKVKKGKPKPFENK